MNITAIIMTVIVIVLIITQITFFRMGKQSDERRFWQRKLEESIADMMRGQGDRYSFTAPRADKTGRCTAQLNKKGHDQPLLIDVENLARFKEVVHNAFLIQSWDRAMQSGGAV